MDADASGSRADETADAAASRQAAEDIMDADACPPAFAANRAPASPAAAILQPPRAEHVLSFFTGSHIIYLLSAPSMHVCSMDGTRTVSFSDVSSLPVI